MTNQCWCLLTQVRGTHEGLAESPLDVSSARPSWINQWLLLEVSLLSKSFRETLIMCAILHRNTFFSRAVALEFLLWLRSLLYLFFT